MNTEINIIVIGVFKLLNLHYNQMTKGDCGRTKDGAL